MVRFSLLVLIGASALFSLASGAPLTATFKLSCGDDALKNTTATVELSDYHMFGGDDFVTRMDDVLVDGKTEHTITGDAHNWFFQWDTYFLKITHKCNPDCLVGSMSFYPFWASDIWSEWTKMNKNGEGEAYRFTNLHNHEMPIDLSIGHNGYGGLYVHESHRDRCV